VCALLATLDIMRLCSWHHLWGQLTRCMAVCSWCVLWWCCHESGAATRHGNNSYEKPNMAVVTHTCAAFLPTTTATAHSWKHIQQARH
jgi:hypothetical protein